MKITAQMMDGVFGGEGATPKDGDAFLNLLELSAPDDAVISDEAWLAIPNDARHRLMSLYFCAVREAIKLRKTKAPTETGK